MPPELNSKVVQSPVRQPLLLGSGGAALPDNPEETINEPDAAVRSSLADRRALTSFALLALTSLVAHPSRALEVAVLLAASVCGTVGRFLLLRGWVFAARLHQEDIR